MSSSKKLFSGLAVSLFLSLNVVAETRVFIDTQGRSLRGELVSVKGDMVTIKREDGQTFTLSAASFCPNDNAYFREHGQKAGVDSSPAKSAPLGSKDAAPAVVIEALIDGPSELHVKKEGIMWVNGENAKPGRHDKQHEPTYINGQGWQPIWKKANKERGIDQTTLHALPFTDPVNLEYKLIAVTINHGGSGIEKRDTVQVTKGTDELIINIPDSQSGARWYKFSLTPAGK